MVAVEQPLDGFAHVAKQMPAVSHLHRAPRPFGRAFGIGPTTITANDLNPWVLLEPSCECLSSPIWQEVHNTLPLQVDQDGTVLTPFSPRPVVYAQYAWRSCFCCWLPSHEAQQRVRTGRYLELLDQPGASFADQCQSDLRLEACQTLRSPRRFRREVG